MYRCENCGCQLEDGVEYQFEHIFDELGLIAEIFFCTDECVYAYQEVVV